MAQHYTIGIAANPNLSGKALASVTTAAARLHHRIMLIRDADAAGLGAVDFLLADIDLPAIRANVPKFGVVYRTQSIIEYDKDRAGRKSAEFAGYFSMVEPVRRFLEHVGEQKNIRRFGLTPERQFLRCPLEKVIAAGSFRLCAVGTGRHGEAGTVLAGLRGRPYVREYTSPVYPGKDSLSGSPSGSTVRWSPQRLYAAFGAGLVADGDDEAELLHQVCEIISVGAFAVCPDVPWIRHLFRERIGFYPRQDKTGALAAIDRLMSDAIRDPGRLAQRAEAARVFFEEELSAEALLANAVAGFEEAKARSLPPATPEQIPVFTNREAISAIFARLSDRTLSKVAEGVATLAPLGPDPRWSFDGFVKSSDLATHIRHSIWLAGKARGGRVPVVLPWHANTRLRVYLDNDLSFTLFASGSFEPNEFSLLARILRPGMVFIDGGANEGAYTVFAAAAIGPKGRLLAVEPSSRERLRLKSNIQLNRLHNVMIVESALAEHAGSDTLLIADDEHAGQNTLGGFSYDVVKLIKQETVSLITLDDIMEQHSLSRVDVVKLDLEGAELRALSGGRRVLERFKPLILLEVLETALVQQQASPGEVFKFLKQAGYVLLRFDDQTGNAVPWDPADIPVPSANIVAVHRAREWGLT